MPCQGVVVSYLFKPIFRFCLSLPFHDIAIFDDLTGIDGMGDH